jgi:hypothetical protein
MAHQTVRCTRTVQLQIRHPRFLRPRSAIIHRTIRCTSGAIATSRNCCLQKLNSRGTVCNSARQSRAAHQRRTGQWTVRVRCGTRLSGATRRQRSNGRLRPNPNGWVTWLAHRTVRCTHRQQPNPNGCLVVEGYKYPSTTSTSTIQAFITLHLIQEQSATLQDTNQSHRSNQSPQFNSSALGLMRRIVLVFFSCSCCLVGFLLSLKEESSIGLSDRLR